MADKCESLVANVAPNDNGNSRVTTFQDIHHIVHLVIVNILCMDIKFCDDNRVTLYMGGIRYF